MPSKDVDMSNEQTKGMQPVSIPTWIVEEHHEAFFVWQQAVCDGMIPETGNLLLHVDEHADMALPWLSTPLREALTSRAALARLTRDELGIADFILPSMYLGTIAEACWLRRGHGQGPEQTTFHLASPNNAGHQLVLEKSAFAAGLLDPKGRRTARLTRITTKSDMPERPGDGADSLLLDIDLDYFHSDDHAAETTQIQITAQEYEAFHADPYHRVRFLGGRIRAEQRGEEFWYVISGHTDIKKVVFDATTVASRIENFASWLRDQRIFPQLITICRSCHSGYVPPQHGPWIEATLLAALRELYPLDLLPFPDLSQDAAQDAAQEPAHVSITA
jgi:hypothetical protein